MVTWWYNVLHRNKLIKQYLTRFAKVRPNPKINAILASSEKIVIRALTHKWHIDRDLILVVLKSAPRVR